MSHELFGMLGAGVGLTALFQRVVQPVPLRLAAIVADRLRSSSMRRQPGSRLASNAESRRIAGGSRRDSTT